MDGANLNDVAANGYLAADVALNISLNLGCHACSTTATITHYGRTGPKPPC